MPLEQHQKPVKEREGIQRDVDTFLLTFTYWSRYMNGIVDITREIKVLTAQVSKKSVLTNNHLSPTQPL
ncbi:hypothetical protein NC651_017882 [Populus alba x Populus x berolinensis]|nr:hypothetical protein NC651_017882 [Populus alba x Populus x berolinensis]